MEIAKDRIPAKVLSILSTQIDEKLTESEEYKLGKLQFLVGQRRAPPLVPVRPKKRFRKSKSLMAKLSVLKKKQSELAAEIGKIWSQLQAGCKCAEEDIVFEVDYPDDTLGNKRGEDYKAECKLCRRVLAKYYEPARYYR